MEGGEDGEQEEDEGDQAAHFGLQPAPTLDGSKNFAQILRLNLKILTKCFDLGSKSLGLAASNLKIWDRNLKILTKCLDSSKVGAGCRPLRRLVPFLLLFPVPPSLRSAASGPSLPNFSGSRWFYPELARARLHTPTLLHKPLDVLRAWERAVEDEPDPIRNAELGPGEGDEVS